VTAMTTKTGKSTKRSPKPQPAATPFAPNLHLSSDQLRLFDEHKGMANMAAAKYGRGRHRESRDDIAQEARTALAKAILSYDPGHKVPFEAYAWKCIQNRCMDFLKKRPEPKSHDDLTNAPGEDTSKPMTLFEQVEALLARREIQDHSEDNYYQRVYQVRYAIAHDLKGTERQAAALFLRGATVVQIAERLKIPKTTAHRALKHAVAKLRKCLKK
jgi:RNA polymerase sigma factor (sigma-70 family)